MKIEGKKPGAATGAEGAKEKKRPSTEKRFAREMQKHKAPKSEDAQGSAGNLGAVLTGKQDLANPNAFQNSEAVVETSVVSMPPPLQGLVREIQVNVEPGGPTQVEIEFNSKAFDGMRVNITKDGGTINVRFMTTNEASAQLISRHIPALSSALAAKGIAVERISLSTASGESGGSSSGDSKSRSSSRNASGGQRRQK